MAAAYSHVIFDLDGTILNTLEDLAAAGNHTCEMHGWPTFAVDEYRYKVGNGMLKLVERFMPAEYAGDSRMRFALGQGRVDAFPPKPEAPVALHVMEELGANPATTLYVGDSNVDVLTGHNAGLKSAGVTWGFRGRAELEAAGADYVVDTQAELAALILGE